MWRQLRRNRLSLAGSVIVVSLLVVAVGGAAARGTARVKLNIRAAVPVARAAATGSGPTSSVATS
ncbi:MAG: hypothetical protein MZV64_70935 [Ignavibacteriales bacterium]|nr:hypothetical protein [Ignavibacteriales bacterium]